MNKKSLNKKGKLYIGTSGWSYPHWAKGVFYPKSVPTQDWLKYYSTYFNAVEVNSTFYRLPNPSLLQRWVNITPADFVFSVKIWRRISHELRLKNVSKELNDFYNSVISLREKTKVYLLQMPPSFVPVIGLLDEFFQNWFQIFNGSLLALELRNKKGFNEEIFEVLKKYNVALCWEDYKGSEIDDVLTADWIYIRKHGPSGRYRGDYDLETLKSEGKKIKVFLQQGKDVYIFFNNDFNGYAPKNASQLRNLISKNE